MTNPIKEFFLFCSGATREVIKQCESEHVKYTGIGATIFFTAVLASISGGYAMYTALQRFYLSIAFGILWGVIIFNLDRFIVSSIKKERIAANISPRALLRAKGQEFFKALPRLILAVFISIVITRPIELRLFESEIGDQINETATVERTQRYEKIEHNYSDIKITEDQTEKLRNRMVEMENELSRRMLVANGELQGFDGTRHAGPGRIYAQRMAEVAKAEADLKAFKTQYDPIINANVGQINKRKQAKEEDMKKAQAAIENPGMLKKLEALFALSMKSWSALLTSSFMILLFISLETAPILVKLFSGRGPYDDHIEALEHQVYATKQEEISRINDDINTRNVLSQQLNAARVLLTQQTMAALSSLAQNHDVATVEVATATVLDWKNNYLSGIKSPIGGSSVSNNGTTDPGSPSVTGQSVSTPATATQPTPTASQTFPSSPAQTGQPVTAQAIP